jgi:hypothetical protein
VGVEARDRGTLGYLDLVHVLLVEIVPAADLADDIIQAQPGGVPLVRENGGDGIGMGDGQIAAGDNLLDTGCVMVLGLTYQIR